MTGKLILSDGTKFEGKSFGAPISHSGEIVFATGMTGYPQAFTDPSFSGQILIMTYPIIGNYGVPAKELWESDKLQINGLVVSDYIDTPSHFQSTMTLADWLKKAKIPGLEIKDTRALTQHLRSKGVMLGKIIIDKEIKQYDPNEENLVAKVSTGKIRYFPTPVKTKSKSITIVVLDCGAKKNIIRCFLNRGVNVIFCPWDLDPFTEQIAKKLRNVILNEVKNLRRSTAKTQDDKLFDALFVSNGPGDPKMADITIQTIKKALNKKIPTLGICLGNQLLALAAGGDTFKLKYGHRSQNQPCKLVDSDLCYITTQNHGFAIKKIPDGFDPWFVNANDKTIEGIKHKKYPFMSVQFHPEATPGPMDTEWIFDYFLERIKK